MSDQQTRERQRQREEQTEGTRAQTATVVSHQPIAPGALVVERGKAGSRQALKPVRRTAKKGKAAEANLRIEWINVPVGNDVSAKWSVATAERNQLEVLVEQAFYKKKYQGAGQLTTQAAPVASLGTEVRVTVRDLTTEEELVEEGAWYSLGGTLWRFVLAILKGLFGLK